MVYPLVAVQAPGGDQDTLAPPILLILAELNVMLLFQPGQQPPHRGVAQVKFLLNVLGAGRICPVGQIPHDPPLGGGQLHLPQSLGHRLGGGAVQKAEHVSVVIQPITSFPESFLGFFSRKSVAHDIIFCNPPEKNLQLHLHPAVWRADSRPLCGILTKGAIVRGRKLEIFTNLSKRRKNTLLL